MKCKICGHLLLEREEPCEICERCFCLELKRILPHIKFIRADGTETENPDEAKFIKGIRYI